MNKEKRMEEFKELCKPLEDFLYKYGDPHTMIVIEQVGARILSGELGISFKLRD